MADRVNGVSQLIKMLQSDGRQFNHYVVDKIIFLLLLNFWPYKEENYRWNDFITQLLSPDASSKGTIEMGVVRPSVCLVSRW